MPASPLIPFSAFEACIEAQPGGVVLLEGRRQITDEFAARAGALARSLATRFPKLRFRSGNATGSDAAFSSGVLSVDPQRLHVVAPYASHRKKYRHAEAQYDSPENLMVLEEAALADQTAAASPKSVRLIDRRSKGGAAAAKAAYLIRDTLKVAGSGTQIPKPIFALFHIDPADPMAGGTGHTIRVCEMEAVPYAFQDSWATWEPL